MSLGRRRKRINTKVSQETAGKFGFYPVTGGGSFAYSHWKQGRGFALYMNILEYYWVVGMKRCKKILKVF